MKYLHDAGLVAKHQRSKPVEAAQTRPSIPVKNSNIGDLQPSDPGISTVDKPIESKEQQPAVVVQQETSVVAEHETDVLVEQETNSPNRRSSHTSNADHAEATATEENVDDNKENIENGTTVPVSSNET